MIQLPEGFDSIFRYIVVVSQRAEQLINGAKARVESRFAKSTLQARADVDAGVVEWRILTQEELDARRQEIVDQFRAEVGADELVKGAPIPDVLPTGAVGLATVLDDGDGEGGDELARLQRLLGMASAAVDDADEGDDLDEDGDGSIDLSEAEPLDDSIVDDVDDEEED